MPILPTVTTRAATCPSRLEESRSELVTAREGEADSRFGRRRASLAPTPRSARASDTDQLPLWLLRAGLAFVFCYAGTAMIVNPAAFMTYVPEVLQGSSMAHTFLLMIAGFELFLVIGLLWPRFTAISALLAAGMMVSIVLLNPDSFGVLFRNVAIASAALSLSLQTRTNRAWGGAEELDTRVRTTGTSSSCSKTSVEVNQESFDRPLPSCVPPPACGPRSEWALRDSNPRPLPCKGSALAN